MCGENSAWLAGCLLTIIARRQEGQGTDIIDAGIAIQCCLGERVRIQLRLRLWWIWVAPKLVVSWRSEGPSSRRKVFPLGVPKVEITGSTPRSITQELEKPQGILRPICGQMFNGIFKMLVDTRF